MDAISPDIFYHSPEELGLLDIPEEPSDSDLLEAEWYLDELGWKKSPILIRAAARVIGAIDGYNWRQDDWVPQAHLQAIAQAVSRYLADQDGTELAKRVLAEQPQLIEMAESLRQRRERELSMVESVLMEREMYGLDDELAGGVHSESVYEMIRSRRALISSRSYTLPAACFDALLRCGVRAALTRERAPEAIDSSPEAIRLIRGRGIASSLTLVEKLSDEAYEWLCQWDDQLTEISQKTETTNERVQELLDAMSEELTDEEIVDLFEDCELTRSLRSADPDQVGARLRLQLAVRLLERARSKDPSDPPNVWM